MALSKIPKRAVSDLDDLDAQIAGLQSQIAGLQSQIAGLVGDPTIYQTITDNFNTVPIGQSAQSFWRAVNHVDVPNVKAGQTFLVIAQGQVRSDWDFNIECAPWLTWTAPPGALAHDGTGHNNVSFYIVGRNFQQTREHYYDWVRVGIKKFTADYDNVRFYNNIRHRSTNGNIDGSGNQVTFVGINQGGISAIRLR